MMSSAILNLAIASFFVEIADCERTDVVYTKYGAVRGEILETRLQGIKYSMFRGIPYAMPPSGELRFRAPEECDHWEGVLEANEERNMCPQLVNNTYKGDEDCLYLNVYTPTTEFKEIESALSVFVFIHGGSFAVGSKKRARLGPDYLIEQNVILVTMNYRLGPLGFLCLPDAGVVCNLALRDQNMAMKWVKDNIEHFGGNPKEITLGGQSAGAVSVHLHMLSPLSSGLFTRSISQSGSPLCFWALHTHQQGQYYAHRLVEALSGSHSQNSSAAALLKAASARDLIEKTDVIANGFYPHFKPTIELRTDDSDSEPFLADCPVQIMESGNYNRMPHMIGFTHDEGLMFEKTIKTAVHYLQNIIIELSDTFLSSTNIFEDEICEISEEGTAQLTELVTDVGFKMCIDLHQRIFAETLDNALYYYMFEFDSPSRSLHRTLYGVEGPGTAHCDDLGYEFYVEAVHPEEEDLTSLENQVAYNFTCLLTNFIKTGNPTPSSQGDCYGPKWIDSREFGIMKYISDKRINVPRQINEVTENNQPLIYNLLKYSGGCS